MSSQPQARQAHRPSTRKQYVDNLRAFLTALVIYHHTSIGYGGEGSVHYRSRHHLNPSAFILAFNALNQTFFMAAFFFISAQFTSTALTNSKASPLQFLTSRVIRLGLPTLVYTIIAQPIHIFSLRVILDHGPINWAILADDFLSIRGIRGPVWYSGLLLIFDTTYVCWWMLFGKQRHLESDSAQGPRRVTEDKRVDHSSRTSISKDSPITILSCILIISVTSFLVRFLFPIDHIFLPLNLRLGYLPQYIGYYIMGLSTSMNLNALSAPSGQSAAVARTSSILIFIAIASTAAAASIVLGASSSPASLQNLKASFSGGLNSPAAVYALWNESVGFLIFTSLLRFFRKHLDRPMPVWAAVPRYSYAAFLVHRPVSEAVGAALDNWHSDAITKTFVVGTINVVLSWVFGWGLFGRALG